MCNAPKGQGKAAWVQLCMFLHTLSVYDLSEYDDATADASEVSCMW